MHRILPIAILVLLSTLAARSGLAEDAAPDVELKAVTQEVLAIVRNDKGIRAGDPSRIADLVESKILPHFDFEHMTRLAAARSWRLATPEQQKALTAEFRTLLVRTYSTALSGYRDQVIEFRPLRAPAGNTDVTVRSVIRQSGAAPLSMDYDMELLAAGWKVYDIKVEGVSLVTTYRETFAAIVRESGVQGLIRSLAEKNRQRAAGLQSHDDRSTAPIPGSCRGSTYAT
jgi:phospholipid transport system substrate-binding protein